MSSRTPSFVASALALFLLETTAAERAQAQPTVDIGTPPAEWVESVTVPPNSAAFDGPHEELLDDRQIHVEGAYASRFVHSAYRIHTAAGVQYASEIVIDLAAEDALQWHYVRRLRGDTTEDLLEPDSVRLIQPESRLDEGLYDERRRAIVFLEDVRPGDRIEYAYTTRRSYAHFGGRFATSEGLGSYRPVRRSRLRVTWPHERELQTRLHSIPDAWVHEREPGTLLIEARELPALAQVNDSPAWYRPQAFVELSEFADWAEVAAWMTATYDRVGQAGLPASVPIDTITSAPTLAARVERALTFVQDDIRYLGFEMGERAVVPHPPSVVVERRFGDCKDKSLLLVTILRHLGVTAHPALVHTRLRHTIDSRLPAPIQFDHVIVRAELDGAVLWLDPTRRAERGPVADRQPPALGRALVGRAGTRGLETLPTPPLAAPTADILERFEVGETRTVLVSTRTFRGADATAYRQLLEEESTADLLQNGVRFYGERGLEVEPAGPLEVDDDPETGAIRVLERYRVERFWREGKRDVSPWAIFERVGHPLLSRNPAPFAIAFPMYVRHRVEVELPFSSAGWIIDPVEHAIEAGPITATRRVTVDGRLLTITVDARSSADQVPGDEVDAYRDELEALDRAIGYEVIEYADPESSDSSAYGTWAALLCLGGPFVAIFAAYLGRLGAGVWRGRRKRAFRRKQRAARGETPDTAIEARDLSDAQARASQIACCGSPADDEGWSTARFGGRRLGIQTGRCRTCGERRRRYYRLLD